jgi:DNA-binding MarR family transcriptional regulator
MESNKQTAAAQLIMRTAPLIMRMVTSELRHKEYKLVPAQLGVLAILSEQSCNLSELAEVNGVSLPTMSGTISKLVAQGWVQRTRSEEDRRMILLELTGEGRSLLEEMGNHIISQLAKLLNPLSGEELTAVNAGLTILQKIFPPFVPLQNQ